MVPQTHQSQGAAFRYAQTLRQSEEKVRVALDLGGRSPQEIREYAQQGRIKHLAWIRENEPPMIETL